MERREASCRQTPGLHRSWFAIGVILFLSQLLVVGAPLHGQALSGNVLDPFEALQKSLDRAANEQLQGGPRPAQLVAKAVAPAAEAEGVRGRAIVFSPENGSRSDRKLSAEEHFRLLGVDAGRIFREEGVPVALLSIAQVESNWKRFALSPKGAFGLWQFMPATAQKYGVRVDGLRDERADVQKSTRAAARYLRDLHFRFGDWALAIAAYNAGERAVERAIERGASGDFWNLSTRRLLPAETRAYVPAVLATFDPPGLGRAIGSAAQSNGQFIRPRVEYAASRQVEVVDVESKGRM